MSQNTKISIFHNSVLKNKLFVTTQSFNFARIRSKKTSKATETMQKLTESKNLRKELESYSFEIDYVDLKKLEMMNTTKGVLNMFSANSTYLHPIFKILIFNKLISTSKSDRLNIQKFINSLEFKEFYESIIKDIK